MVVSSENVYRAYCSNGVILEYDSGHFKELFRAAVCELKGTYGHSLYFERGSARIVYGVLVEVLHVTGKRSSTFLEERSICDLSIRSINYKTRIIIRR